MEIPIACALDPGEARAQLGEWRSLLAGAAHGWERVGPGRLEVVPESAPVLDEFATLLEPG